MTSNSKRKSIVVTFKEKEKLESAKHLYEQHTGDGGDWGKFLGTISMLGLAALGIYKLAQASRKKRKSVCPVCDREFSIAYGDDLPAVAYITCPHCGEELVVEFREP